MKSFGLLFTDIGFFGNWQYAGWFLVARVAVKWGAPAVKIFPFVALFFASLILLGAFELFYSPLIYLHHL